MLTLPGPASWWSSTKINSNIMQKYVCSSTPVLFVNVSEHPQVMFTQAAEPETLDILKNWHVDRVATGSGSCRRLSAHGRRTRKVGGVVHSNLKLPISSFGMLGQLTHTLTSRHLHLRSLPPPPICESPICTAGSRLYNVKAWALTHSLSYDLLWTIPLELTLITPPSAAHACVLWCLTPSLVFG